MDQKLEKKLFSMKNNLLKLQEKIDLLQSKEENLQQYIYELECQLTETLINSEADLTSEEE